jgi:hypothetical protein
MDWFKGIEHPGIGKLITRTGDSKSEKRNFIRGTNVLLNYPPIITSIIPSLRLPRHKGDYRPSIVSAFLVTVPLFIKIKMAGLHVNAIMIDCYFKGPSLVFMVLLQCTHKVYILTHLLRDFYHIYNTRLNIKLSNRSQFESIVVGKQMLRSLPGSQTFTKATTSNWNMVFDLMTCDFFRTHKKKQYVTKPSLSHMVDELQRVSPVLSKHSQNCQCVAKILTVNMMVDESTTKQQVIGTILSLLNRPWDANYDYEKLSQYADQSEKYWQSYVWPS